ncbi:MAG: vWA domain-containing protein, partial [Acidimicrobiales bacterium]
MAGLDTVAVTMARTLRGLGVAAPPDATVAYAAALAEVGVHRRSSTYWAGRATLVRRPEDVPAYDRAFAAVFEGRTWDGDGSVAAEPETVTLLFDTDEEPPPGDAGDEPQPVDGPTFTLRWTDREHLRSKDFARCSVDELDEAHRLMADLHLAGARRASRRQRPTSRRRGPIDVGATTRRSLRTGGEPLRTVHRQAGDRPRRVVLLCDVSGSMEAYTRALLLFLHATVRSGRGVEVFAFGTRLTRLTPDLSSRDPERALARAAERVVDWAAGTRIGASLKEFNDIWGRRALSRG